MSSTFMESTRKIARAKRMSPRATARHAAYIFILADPFFQTISTKSKEKARDVIKQVVNEDPSRPLPIVKALVMERLKLAGLSPKRVASPKEAEKMLSPHSKTGKDRGKKRVERSASSGIGSLTRGMQTMRLAPQHHAPAQDVAALIQGMQGMRMHSPPVQKVAKKVKRASPTLEDDLIAHFQRAVTFGKPQRGVTVGKPKTRKTRAIVSGPVRETARVRAMKAAQEAAKRKDAEATIRMAADQQARTEQRRNTKAINDLMKKFGL